MLTDVLTRWGVDDCVEVFALRVRYVDLLVCLMIAGVGIEVSCRRAGVDDYLEVFVLGSSVC